jgi:tRNA A-37 threonylcarbamoyl transferase component Bud32
MSVIIPLKWQHWLSQENLSSFESWWALSLEAVDETNVGRGGWSTVYKYSHKGRTFYVKRQANHLSRSLSAFLRKVPTFEIEFNQIHRYQHHGIPCIEPVFFAARKEEGEYQAILVTEALEGWCSLDELLLSSKDDKARVLNFKAKNELCGALAVAIRKLHEAGIQHYNLYPKHIFVRASDFGFEVRFIDLETSGFNLGFLRGKLKDIETLSRRTKWISRTDRLRFMLKYFDKTSLDPALRRAIKMIKARSDRKSRGKP